MNKETVKKILKNEQLNQQEFFEFITDYVKSELNEDISHEQLMALAAVLQQGLFSIRYAAEIAANKLELNYLNVLDKNGKYITTIFTENAN